MQQYVINKLGDMDIKENHEEDLLFIDRNRNTLKVYDNYASTGEETTTWVDNEVSYDATY